MAGHSKWANIRHRKERADKQKGKIFSRMAKEIISAVRQGGADPKNNPRLKLAIEKSKSANFPNENIERNIKKASSSYEENYESITYEIYGYGGVGIIVEVTTDNKNRAASEMRIAINKRGGNLANPGSVIFNFDRKGILQLDRKNRDDEEQLFNAALEAGAEDFEAADEGFIITTSPTELFFVKEVLEKKGYATTEADIVMIAKTVIECQEESQKANLALIEWLEEIDDVDAVYHNMDL